MSARFRVLVSAYACNPRAGSEEGVGWGWVRALAARHDLCVLTAAFHRADIEQAQREDPAAAGIRFVYVPHRLWHYRPTPGWRAIESSIAKPLMNWAYRLWLRDAGRLARSLHRNQPFDLAHQLTYVGFRFPGHLWKLDIPFVWGPIGGLENTPWRLLPLLGAGGAGYYAARNIVNSFQKTCLVAPRRALRKARGGIIAATSGIQREIRRWYGEDSIVVAETGPLQNAPASAPRARRPGEPLRMTWSGQHLPGKALPLLLNALHRLPPALDWRLDILGDGPCRSKWQREASRLGIAARCRWHGLLPRHEAVARMAASHVFVITSLKDLTSTVILEALSLAVPVIALNHCGFPDVLTADCGILVPVHNPAQIAADLARAIEKLASDETERYRLAGGAPRRAADFSWEKKVAMVDAIYRRKLQSAQRQEDS